MTQLNTGVDRTWAWGYVDCRPVRTRPGGGRDEGLVALVAQGAGMGSWSSRSCSGAML